MHPMSRSGQPPAGFGGASQPPRHVRPQSPEPVRVDGLRHSLRRIDRRLVSVNGACFVSLVLLAGAAPGVLAREVIGRINLGLLLCGALGVLAVCTTFAYDRRLARELDPEADRIKARQEQQEAAATAATAGARNRNPTHRRAEW
ncbi:DUF485 domain-containing protein [Streptacidiphilus sp. NEAU-YB345]|uniref:DUF485 domain-containing protein n=2 Tax=Streptacidiphilus fuscans TaxID=2789292 RepID=A0A931B702_9ACTN|nr:DUF485 domain-containing protein [Streptacidiphilus fuscans]